MHPSGAVAIFGLIQRSIRRELSQRPLRAFNLSLLLLTSNLSRSLLHPHGEPGSLKVTGMKLPSVVSQVNGSLVDRTIYCQESVDRHSFSSATKARGKYWQGRGGNKETRGCPASPTIETSKTSHVHPAHQRRAIGKDHVLLTVYSTKRICKFPDAVRHRRCSASFLLSGQDGPWK